MLILINICSIFSQRMCIIYVFCILLPGTEPTISKGKSNCKALASLFGLPPPLTKGLFAPPQPFPSHQLFPRLEGFPSTDRSHIQHSLTLVGGVARLLQHYQHAGSSPGRLQARYTWNPLNFVNRV